MERPIRVLALSNEQKRNTPRTSARGISFVVSALLLDELLLELAQCLAVA